MELRSLQSPTIVGISCANLKENLFLSGKLINIPNSKKFPHARKLKLPGFRAQASANVSSVAVESIPKIANSKDDNLVFVAGATGRVGSRTVRELLKLGFKVRAGVRSAQRAEPLLQSVKQMKLEAGIESGGPKPIEKLEIVECDLEKREQIGPALGNASVVMCCIGASEKEIFDITGPYRIDYQATKNLIDAATATKVNHFILLTSLGTNKVGFPAAILNLFWGVLIWKRKAEEALIASGLPYTIVRPGGMERPTDAYKETHNITLSQEDTLFGGQVSNLQVAELMAYMARNRSLSYCKVVEVIAETTAPLTPMGDLLAKIPSQHAEVKPMKKQGTADGPQSAASKSVISEPPSSPVEKEPPNVKTMETGPLSPYAMYEDLKPPVSPTPTPSTSAGSTKAANINDVSSTKQVNTISEIPSAATETEAFLTEVTKSSPLSPYTAYEDLRPPSSPSPTPSGPREATANVVSDISGGNDVANITSSSEQDPPFVFSSHHSPYNAYDDQLKPPTSPSPNAPTGSLLSLSSSKLENEHHDAKPKTRPLSPFTMYDDLKPPTSPSPAPRK